MSEPKIALPLTMTSFTEDMARRGMRAGQPRALVRADQRRREARPAAADLARSTRSGRSAACAWPTTRRWRSSSSTSRAGCCPDLKREDLEEHSFYSLLQEGNGIAIASGIQTIEPTVVNEDEAEMLAVPVHSPAFLFERTTESEGGEVVEYVRSLYRGDRYRLVTELRPPLR